MSFVQQVKTQKGRDKNKIIPEIKISASVDSELPSAPLTLFCPKGTHHQHLRNLLGKVRNLLKNPLGGVSLWGLRPGWKETRNGAAQYPCKAPRAFTILSRFPSQVCFQERLSYTICKRGCKRWVWSGLPGGPRSLPAGWGGGSGPSPQPAPRREVQSALRFPSSPLPPSAALPSARPTSERRAP